MRRVVFEASAFEDFTDWGKQEKKTFAKICNLIRDIQRSSFSGLGKPEPLKHDPMTRLSSLPASITTTEC
ncbi:MAG: hypothetical protein CVU38_17690 [Chloroflexi bacterium HGW-Chloroflexi-1]|nr:MAG: hypothetical protein CVU38_17690 [Chloroflexi bacterium HGW-Chloroflexi-1]